MTVAQRNAAPSEAALASVRKFFAGTETMTHAEAVILSREFRRSGRRPNLHTDADFLTAVTRGSWGPGHSGAARQIRSQSRAQAAVLVSWPRRAALAGALEAAALAVLSEADERRPLPENLCARLTAPYQRTLGGLVPQQRSYA